MIAVPSLASGLGDNATNIGEALIDGVDYSYRKTSMMVVLSLCPLPLLRLLQMLNSKPQQVYMLKIATQGGTRIKSPMYQIQYNIRAGVFSKNLPHFSIITGKMMSL